MNTKRDEGTPTMGGALIFQGDIQVEERRVGDIRLIQRQPVKVIIGGQNVGDTVNDYVKEVRKAMGIEDSDFERLSGIRTLPGRWLLMMCPVPDTPAGLEGHAREVSITIPLDDTENSNTS